MMTALLVRIGLSDFQAFSRLRGSAELACRVLKDWRRLKPGAHLRSFQNIRAALLAAARLGALTVAASALSLSSAAASPILNVAGSTQGCFGTGCTTFGTSVESVESYGLTFTGSPFDIVTGDSGLAGAFALGTLTRDNVNVSDELAALPFTLKVVFTLPTGIGGSEGSTFSAFISGTNNGGGGHLAINFDNTWQTFDFTNASGSGSFEFGVPLDLSVNKNNSSQILGGIRSATFTSTGAADDVAPVPVPESASLLLFGTGLSAAAYRLRWRRQA